MTYAFAHDKPERLAGIEATWDSGTLARIEALGVAPGWRCLEVGAGGGSVATWLADRVGPTGHVLATDVDTTFLESLAGGSLEIQRHDVLRDPLPDGAFDLVHARLLLEWLGDSDALARLVGALAPGGWLLVEDFDWAIGGPDAAAAPATHKAFAAILGLLDSIGYRRHHGRTLPEALDRAGLTDTGNDSRSYVVRGGSPGTAFERGSMQAQRDRLIDSGALTDAEFETAIDELGDPARYVLTPMMFAVWGRKPGA